MKTAKLRKFWASMAIIFMMSQVFIPSGTALAEVLSDEKGNLTQVDKGKESDKEDLAEVVDSSSESENRESIKENGSGAEKEREKTVGESQNSNDSPYTTTELAIPSLEKVVNSTEATDLNVLTFGEDGTPRLNGEIFYKTESQITNEDLVELMKQGDSLGGYAKLEKAGVAVEYLGQVTNGVSTVGNFKVNGQQAYCVEHSKPTPPSGAPNNGDVPYANDNIKKTLYFGWDGTENIFTDFSEGVTATSLVLSYFYTGIASGLNEPGPKALLDKVAASDVPNEIASFSKINPSVYVENNIQRTENIKLNGDTRNKFTFNVPASMTFKNVTTGETFTNKNVTIKGGDTFFLSADLAYSNNYSTGNLSGSMKKYQAVLTTMLDSNLQTLGRGGWFDPGFTIQFTANFYAREGWLNLVKKGNDTTQNLAGADYQILQNNVVLQTVTTAADGTMKTKGFLPGNYQVKEIKAPNGYLLDKTVKTVTVRSNETTTVTFTNTAVLGQFVLFKADAQTGTIAQGDASLAGAEFDIKNAAGTVVDHLVIAPDGSEFKATSKKLPLGKYLRVETKAPPGYVLDPTPVEMELKYETQDIPLVTTTATVKNQVILGKVAIQKYYELIIGGGHLSPEAGAEFSFTLKSSGVEYDRKETDEKGYVETDKLPFGTYIVHQTKSLPGLLKVDDFEVEVTEDGATYFYALLNNHFVSPLKLIKADEDTGKNVLVPGTIFKIKSVETGEWLSQTTHNITEFETNEQGEVLLFDKVKHGDYLLYEIEAPDGYVKNPEPMPFSVTEENQEEGLVTVTFKNKAQVGKVTLSKTGEALTSATERETNYGTQYTPIFTQKPLEGAAFKFSAAEDIYTNDGTLRYSKYEVVDSGVSDAAGQIVTDPETKPFYPGKYYAVETSAPAGYVVDPTPIPFEVEYEGQDVEISSTAVQAKNVLQELLIKIYKTEGAVIEWENGQPVIEQTPSDGKVFGVFARDGFQFNEKELIPASGLMAVAATKDGVAEVQAKFPEGKFFVREVDAGTDHLLDEKEYDFEFTAQTNAPVFEIGIWKDSVAYGNENNLKIARNSIENELAVQEIELVKVDLETTLGSETPLANVPFKLIQTKNGKDTVIGTYKTNEAGKINVTVPVGTYRFVEVEPLENYLPSDQEYPFEVTVEHNGDKILLKAINKLKAPKLGTKATGINGEKDFDSTIENTVVDDLNFYIPLLNQEMTIVTELKEASTGKVVQSQEEKKTFTEANGTHRITMVIPANTLDPGKDYVFAEHVYRDSEKTILYVAHDDLGDKGQTIHMRPLVRFFPQTGEEKTTFFLALGVVMIGLAGVYLSARAYKKELD